MPSYRPTCYFGNFLGPLLCGTPPAGGYGGGRYASAPNKLFEFLYIAVGEF